MCCINNHLLKLYLFLLNIMILDDNSFKAPSKCIKVERNNNCPEMGKQIILEQCTKNSNVIHRRISSSVSVVADLKFCLDAKIKPSKYMDQI